MTQGQKKGYIKDVYHDTSHFCYFIVYQALYTFTYSVNIVKISVPRLAISLVLLT